MSNNPWRKTFIVDNLHVLEMNNADCKEVCNSVGDLVVKDINTWFKLLDGYPYIKSSNYKSLPRVYNTNN